MMNFKFSNSQNYYLITSFRSIIKLFSEKKCFDVCQNKFLESGSKIALLNFFFNLIYNRLLTKYHHFLKVLKIICTFLSLSISYLL